MNETNQNLHQVLNNVFDNTFNSLQKCLQERFQECIQEYLKECFQECLQEHFIFSIGTYVKIYKPWSDKKLSKKIFKISQVVEGYPIIYKLKDFDGNELIADFYAKDITIV
jgi:hypothetical protein